MKCYFLKFIDNIDIREYAKFSERLFQVMLCELFCFSIYLKINFFSLRKISVIFVLQRNNTLFTKLCELFALAILGLNFFSLRKISAFSALQKNSE